MTIAKVIAGRPSEVVNCSVTASVKEAVKLLAEKRIGAVPVMDGNAIAGIFSERDVLYRLNDHGGDILTMSVAQVMTSPAITVEPSTRVMEALSLMTMRRIRHLPVVSGGRMVGFISIGDLVKHRLELMQGEADAMRNYIQMA